MGDRGDSVLPNDSASHNGVESPEHSAITGATSPQVENMPFAFKFKAPSGRMHRLHVVGTAGIADLVAQVAQKLGSEADSIGGVPEVDSDGGRLGKSSGFALSYLDNEGDSVSITTDQDLLDAIMLATRGRRDKVDLFVHDPEKPPLPGTVDPQPALAPIPESTTVRERKRYSSDEDDGDEDVDRSRSRRQQRGHQQQTQQQEQVIAGVPNDVLLPGAIVTLAVVIVGVFAISRATSR
jgi:hypothetical protein